MQAVSSFVSIKLLKANKKTAGTMEHFWEFNKIFQGRSFLGMDSNWKHICALKPCFLSSVLVRIVLKMKWCYMYFLR